MNLTEAVAQATALTIPGFMEDEATLSSDRQTNEQALAILLAEWWAAEEGSEPIAFADIQSLADRNRDVCDLLGDRLRNSRTSSALSRGLSDSDKLRAIAALQHRKPKQVEKDVGGDMAGGLAYAYAAAPISGTVVGIDIETTSIDPARGYIINVGLEFMNMAPDTNPTNAYSCYCGLPELYKERGVPLEEIHHITWSDLEGKTPFRLDDKMQKTLLQLFVTYPFMAHNASFEDSWFTMHIAGYAEARKAGRIIPIDSRDICRALDPAYKTLPHEAKPTALENWAKRRGTLAEDESERHLGLEDVDLMFKTVQAEFKERNIF